MGQPKAAFCKCACSLNQVAGHEHADFYHVEKFFFLSFPPPLSISYLDKLISPFLFFYYYYFFLLTFIGKNLPRYNQMNINVATWARIIKRTQPNEHQHSNPGSLSSGGSVTQARPSLSSTTRPLPLNLITSPASVSLPLVSASANSSPPPPLETPTDTHDSNKLEQQAGEKHGLPGATGTSMARPLSLSLSSPVVPVLGNVGIITSPVTPTLTSTIVPIQFPPSGKKPAPPPPPRTTSVITIGHTTPVQPPQPLPRGSYTPTDTIEDAKVNRRSTSRTRNPFQPHSSSHPPPITHTLYFLLLTFFSLPSMTLSGGGLFSVSGVYVYDDINSWYFTESLAVRVVEKKKENGRLISWTLDVWPSDPFILGPARAQYGPYWMKVEWQYQFSFFSF